MSKLDTSPLTVVVSESLDPRVKKKLEAQQQADVLTHKEFAEQMEINEDLANMQKPKKEPQATPPAEPAEQKPAAEDDPNAKQQPAPATQTPQPTPAPAANPTPPAGNDAQQNNQPAPTPPAAKPAEPTQQPANNNQPADSNDEDLSTAFESATHNLDFLAHSLGVKFAMESQQQDADLAEQNVKNFIHISADQTGIDRKTSLAIQQLQDPNNAVVVIDEVGVKDAESLARLRSYGKTLAGRGAKVFNSLDDSIDYLNEVYDELTGNNQS